MRSAWAAALGVVWLAAGPAVGQELQVSQAGPRGELAERAEAAEVRVVFSEPMVALGSIPDPVRAPFLRIEPALEGRLRWSGTRTLIFTPSDPEALPWGTRYTVTVDTSAASAEGRRLARPYTFSFTTPTLRLLGAQWYRKGGRFDGPVVIGLRFNQPVDAAALAPGVSLRRQPHDFEAPAPPEASALDPASRADFEARVAAARQAAGATGTLPARRAGSFDKEQLEPGDELLVLETTEVPPPDTWIEVQVAAGSRGRQGQAGAAKAQSQTLQLERTFFVDGLRCSRACDPESWNPVRFRGEVRTEAFRARTRASDVTDPAKPEPLKKTLRAEDAQDGEHDLAAELSLQDAGYGVLPARAYEVVVDRALTAADGQTLGYTWVGRMDNWHQRAFTSFGSGHGVWEATGGPQLPFYARNLREVKQWAVRVPPEDLVPTLVRLQEKNFGLLPEGAGTARTLSPRPDRIQSHGIDLAPVLGPGGTGLVWAGLENGAPIARSRKDTSEPRSTVVQVTNLGVSVKDSPAGTLVLVTGLADAQPVEGATVTLRTRDNVVRFTGTTGADGIVIAPALPLRNEEEWWSFSFVAIAEKDGDVAFVGSDWTEGTEAWWFDGVDYDLTEAKPLLRGTVFADRGVYKLGEQVRLKAILRSDTTAGISLLPPGTPVKLVLRDSQGNDVETRTVTLGEWSSADWTMTLPTAAPLGGWHVAATVEGQSREAVGNFLVAAYRRPDFRVEAELAGESPVAGSGLSGVVSARYLFGAPMAGREVRWSLSRTSLAEPPRAVAGRFPAERWVMADEVSEPRFSAEVVQGRQEELDAAGLLALKLDTDPAAGVPVEYVLEGEVTDVSRQVIAGRASARVEPSSVVAGFRRPSFFVEASRGLATEVVATDLAGLPRAGVPVSLQLVQVQWNSVRRAEGNGFYTWETERREVPAGQWEVTSGEQPSPLQIDLPSGGFFVLKAVGRDEAGRLTTAAASFYAIGHGYTAWERYDHNRIDLVPEKKTYRPGETARLLVKSPWEGATALLTTEREGVRSHRLLTLRSTQETLEVPVTEADIPNVYVSLLLLKGRTGQFTAEDATDPGKPAFRLGYVELKVEDAAKRLKVAVTTDREEYRPAARAKVEVSVADAQGRPAVSEVTLWAVDYGVLSLTGYRTPDVLSSVWVEKALQVMNTNSRQNIISRRVLVSKGGDEGGGGGLDQGPGDNVRRDFRVLAFWLGSVVTDARGRASTQVTLPESLTTYRVMAVAQDRASRFGGAEREIRTSKPVLLRPTLPRFLSVGDEAVLGSVVHNQLKDGGAAIVTLRSLDPSVLEVAGESQQAVRLESRGSQEVRFRLRAKAAGNGRVQVSVKLRGETDAFEEVIPVRVPSTPLTVAAHGQAGTEARESIEVPRDAVPGFGGLRVETASTALVGLGEGARYLVEYPYGCAEQRASATLALLLAAELGDTFRLPGVDAAMMKERARESLRELEEFQCEGGGFAFWKGQCDTVSPYLTSWVTHVKQRGKGLGYPVKATVLEQAHGYLERELATARPAQEGFWPAFLAARAFSVKVLAEGGRNVDSHLARLHQDLDRMPHFALSHLLDAHTARGESGARPEELERRLRNAVLPEGGTAHVEERSDPDLLWLWSSSVRSTAMALSSFARRPSGHDLAAPMARWLLQARVNGRWSNTQENAWALLALVDYYRALESETPDFGAAVSLDGEVVSRQEFRGRSTAAQVVEVPLADLSRRAAGDGRLDLGLRKEGPGTLFYAARLRHAVAGLPETGRDLGFVVDRRYERTGPPGSTLAGKPEAPATRFAAGDLVRVTLTVRVPKERRYVAVTDPLPAGFEPVETWFATTARDVARQHETEQETERSWTEWFRRGGFDRVERHDDRIDLFATRLGAGEHVFSYVVRATTTGEFRAGATRAEEMYSPEVSGRTAGAVVGVR